MEIHVFFIFCISVNGDDGTVLRLTLLHLINFVKYHMTSVSDSARARGPVLISLLLNHLSAQLKRNFILNYLVILRCIKC
jgi:hypothetical protein